MQQAAQLLHEYRFTRVYASALRRSIQSARIILAANDSPLALPIETTWRLNERHYGALEGLNKKDSSRKFGEEQVLKWRRGYHTRPPPVGRDDPRHPAQTAQYADIADQVIPGESPADCFERVKIWWDQQAWQDRDQILICAHGTSLRMIMKLVEGLSEEAIEKNEIPSSVPIRYTLRAGDRALLTKEILMAPDEFARRQQAVAAESAP